MPNGHKATFYDVWSGHRVRPARFQKHLHDDVTHVVRLLATACSPPKLPHACPSTKPAPKWNSPKSRTAFRKVVLIA